MKRQEQCRETEMWPHELNLTPTRRHSCLPAEQQRLQASSVSPPASPFFPEPKIKKRMKKTSKVRTLGLSLRFNLDIYSHYLKTTTVNN